MKVSRRLLARHIASELRAGTSRKAVLEGLAAYIVVNHLQSQVKLIMADIAVNLAGLGHVEATVTTVRPFDEALRTELVAYVTRIEKADTVILDEQIDTSILGGVIIETPKARFDASVRTRLKRLKNA